jgi:methionyl-tRNA formyltransferase
VRVVFMGTPQFAVPSLERLARAHDVVAVYARPDAVSGRGSDSRPAPVKVAATRLGIPVWQPSTLRDSEVVRELERLGADVVCVAAYGLILPQPVLEVARFGAINVHASLLPRWRGAAPIQRAILAGDARVGVSIMRMEAGLDTGPYCLQQSVASDGKSAVELTAELAELGAGLLISALPAIADGTATWTDQAEDEVTYATKVTKADVAPDPALTAEENLARIRAATSAAPARVLIDNRGVTVLEAVADTDPSALSAGQLQARAGGIALGASRGAMLLLRVKPDGKGEMDASAWARGARLAAGAAWGRAR